MWWQVEIAWPTYDAVEGMVDVDTAIAFPLFVRRPKCTVMFVFDLWLTLPASLFHPALAWLFQLL
jgi:hypothetical protein